MRTPLRTELLAVAAIGLGVVGRMAVENRGPWRVPDGLREHDVVIRVEREGVGSDGVAFYASNLEQEGALAGDYGGRLHREGAELRAELRGITLRLAPGEWEGGMVSAIRLALVEATPNGWSEVKSGAPREMAMPLDLGPVRLSDLTLTIPDVSPEDMVGRWVAIVHEVSGPDGQRMEVALHADEAILDRLMGWFMGGC